MSRTMEQSISLHSQEGIADGFLHFCYRKIKPILPVTLNTSEVV